MDSGTQNPTGPPEKIDGGYPKACTVNVIIDLTSVEIAKTARRAAKRSVRIMVMVC